MSRTVKGSKCVGYDYGSKRIGNNNFAISPEKNPTRTSIKKITNRRERCAFRSKLKVNDY